MNARNSRVVGYWEVDFWFARQLARVTMLLLPCSLPAWSNSVVECRSTAWMNRSFNGATQIHGAAGDSLG
jgi:hypothetical protein